MKKFSIFHLEGGLGKHVLSTAIARCIKNNHPDRELVVVCAYPDIYVNLDFVDRVYRIGMTPYFYQDFILNKDVLIFKHEPYFTTEHITKQLPLIENWCKMYNLKYSGEMPSIEFNIREKQFGMKKWSREKPIMVLQTNGGPIQGQKFPYSWTRDIPQHISQNLVNHFSEKYHIIQICREESQVIQGVAEAHYEVMSNMEFFSLLLVSKREILIDSCLQHASAAIGKSSTVLWVGTSPNVFGYKNHSNIVAKIPTNKLPNSYLFDYEFTGQIHECPIKDFTGVFNIQDIIDSIH